MTRLLEGVRILDLGRMLAAPTATQILADFGAEVIKIERPKVGDDNRKFVASELADCHPSIASPLFSVANRGKKSVTIDLAKPEGQALVRELAQQCDVVVENFKTGDLARKGLDYDSIRALRPDIIYCSLTAFGQSGPLASGGGIDSLFQAMSGVMGVTGDPDAAPLKVGFFIGDVLGGLYATIAILGALAHRNAGGGGQAIDISMVETMIAAMGHHFQHYLMTGKVPERMGNGSAEGSIPVGAFRATDGYVQLSAPGQDRYVALCRALERQDLIDDPRYATPDARTRNRERLMGIFRGIIEQESCRYWVDRLAPQGVVIARINNVAEALAEPQMIAREVVRTVAHPETGELKILANPIRFSDTPVAYGPVPILGEHTDMVLADVLGYDAGKITALRDAAVL